MTHQAWSEVWHPVAEDVTARKRGTPYDPAMALFGAGEQGGVYDIQDLSTLFQSSDGTVPVTAPGDPVEYVTDLSGNGNHIIHATTPPTLRLDAVGGGYYLEFDGTNDSLATVGSVDFSASDKLTVFALAQFDVTAVQQTLLSVGDGLGNAGSFDVGLNANGILTYRRGNGTWGARGLSGPATTGAVLGVTVQFDLAGATHATEYVLRLDGVVQTVFETDYNQADTGGGNFGSYPISVGLGSNRLKGRVYRMIVRGGPSTADEVTAAEAWIRGGNSIPAFSYTPAGLASFTDTGAAINRATHFQTSSYASMDFTTTATVLEVNSHNTLWNVYPDFTNLGVIVDNEYFATVSPTALGSHVARVTLPAGTKEVSIVAGMQATGFVNSPGAFITKVRGNAAMTQVNLTPSNRVVIYGDSIACGQDATPLHEDSWAIQVRRAYYPDSIALEATGGTALWVDCVDATARGVFVAQIVAYAPERIWLAIGTNDYGLNLWTAANFGTAYAALLDDLNTALPSATIFAQTPLLRSVETANGLGSTLGDYRTQIATAQSTRSSYCTLVDGTAIMTTASLADGVHPTTAGHTLYANYVKTVLGI